MYSPGAGLGEGPRECNRVTGPRDHGVVGTLVEPHRAPAEHVDGGDHLDRAAPGKPLLPLG